MRSVTAGTGLVVVALTATLAALIHPIWSYADRSGTGPARLDAGAVATRWGPLSAADRDLVVRVRLAGLWEIPAGRQALERAPTRAVEEAGAHLVEGHTFLDARVREVAAQLDMELPDQPTAQQRDWLTELSGADKAAYETTFANILRAAHGKVFTLIAQVRHTTRNTLVRGLADDANTTVLDHIRMLEATGRVDFDALAADAAGTAAASPTGPPPPAAPDRTTPPPAAPTAPPTTFPLPPPTARPKDWPRPPGTGTWP